MNHPERGLFVPLNHLRILVHPLFAVGREVEIRAGRHKEEYLRERCILFDNVLDRFLPLGPTDLTAVMPRHLRRYRVRDDFAEINKALTQNPDLPTWPKLYRQLERRATDPGRVLLVPNMLDGENGGAMGLERRINAAGFAIAAQSVITLGGEWLEVCVETVGRDLFELPQVNVVRIDKQMITLGFTDVGARGSFEAYPGDTTAIITEDAEYYYLTRNTTKPDNNVNLQFLI